ncbi:hypothetical protein LOAG_02167 [Loa loa]|uniref:Uncharacterized protein n=1 Tax=Loa loa TaxID=7209 RepID=A0A1S0U993_LOALO|nr:hypothetical protein LOAG_02167 [Loa loa]EFO26312.1 hypothetical protein LOAG_02167 [Loa loa]
MSGRKEKVAVPRNPVIVARHLKEAKNIIFENGRMSNDDFTNEFHSLPCKIEYDGPAKVSQYFVTEELEDNQKVATFRGRILNGVQQQFPDAYRLYIAVEKEDRVSELVSFSSRRKERSAAENRLKVDSGIQEFADNSRVFEVSGSAASFTRWEYDRSSSYQSPLVRAIGYLNIAETFAKDDD